MTKSRIVDLSVELGATSIDASRPRHRILRGITQKTRDMTDGLYAAVYVNRGADVRDNNRKGVGNVVIPAGAAMLKYGKFQGGVVARYQTQLDHLRRGHGENVERYVYGSLVKSILVFDLTRWRGGNAWSPAHVFEHFWNASIEQWLRNEELLHESAGPRLESRPLRRTPTAASLTALLEPLAERIEKAVHVLGR